MPKKPETLISNHVLPRLRAEGGWWVKVHGGLFQEAGIPDIIGCWNGKFVAIELKTPQGEPSELQKYTLNKLDSVGAIVGIATSVSEALGIRDEKIKFQRF